MRGSVGPGIFVSACDFPTITANTLGGNGVGISLSNVLSATISENDASGNGIGMATVAPDGLPSTGTVSHNIFNGNTSIGLRMFIAKLIVLNNVTNGNGLDGIHVEFSGPVTGANEVINNTSLANGMNDLFDGVPGCTGNVWSGNTFLTANQSCIH